MSPSGQVPDTAATNFNEEETTREEREGSPHDEATHSAIDSAEDQMGESDGHEDQMDLAGQPTGGDQPSHSDQSNQLDQSNQPNQSNQPQEPDSESPLQNNVTDDSEAMSMDNLLNTLEAIAAATESEEMDKKEGEFRLLMVVGKEK